jgi:hypothetical protein
VWRRSELALLIFTACRRDPPPPAIVVDAGAPATAIVDAAAEPGRARAPATVDAPLTIVDAGPRHARAAKSIGHTSVVFKIEQTDGKKIVWKPDSRIGKGRFRAEIAAYRLAMLLGIDNVPPAVPLDIPKDELARAIAGDEKAKELFEKQVIADGGVVHGAFTEWIDDYEVLPLESDAHWRKWLELDAEIPADKMRLAREASTLVLFDYLTANWDRWSGANIATSKALGGRMLYVDNDAAFFENPPAEGLARNERYLDGVQRLSRSLVERLRSVTDEEIAKAIDILPKKAIDGVLARRNEALAKVAKKKLYFD